MKYSMIILAGGRSSRMGRDKSELMLGEDTFLEAQIRKGRMPSRPRLHTPKRTVQTRSRSL